MSYSMIVSVFDKDREILITSGENDEEGVWFTVAEPLVERAKRDLFLAIVPELDAEGNLVDWVPVPTGAKIEPSATQDSDNGLCETCAFVDKELAQVKAERDQARAEVERLLNLLGRQNPVRCTECGELREADEQLCGNCGTEHP